MQQGFQLSVVPMKAFMERSHSPELVEASHGDPVTAYRVRGVYGHTTLVDITCPGGVVADCILTAQSLAHHLGQDIEKARDDRLKREEDAAADNAAALAAEQQS